MTLHVLSVFGFMPEDGYPSFWMVTFFPFLDAFDEIDMMSDAGINVVYNEWMYKYVSAVGTQYISFLSGKPFRKLNTLQLTVPVNMSHTRLMCTKP